MSFAGNADLFLSEPELFLKQVYAWCDVKLTIKTLYSGCTVSTKVCDYGVTLGVRAPTFLSNPTPISIPTFVSSLFPICLTTGGSVSSMPASESAIVDVTKPTSIALCNSLLPCSTNVAAVVTVTAGSIPDKAQVCGLCIKTRGFLLKPASGASHHTEKTSRQ